MDPLSSSNPFKVSDIQVNIIAPTLFKDSIFNLILFRNFLLNSRSETMNQHILMIPYGLQMSSGRPCHR